LLFEAYSRPRLAWDLLVDAYARPRPRVHHGPLVTVVIAAYNRSEVLRHALASVLRQTYGELEVLVIGDACTDDSGEVVESFRDRRVSWINLPSNTGSQTGPNQVGLERARGELIAYLGQDDLWRRDHVALLVGHWQASGAEVVSSVVEHVWPGALGARRFDSTPPRGHVVPSSLMHERAAGLRAGGWIDHRLTVGLPDVDFVIRMLESATYSRVHALSVVKFASAQRPGSYVARLDDEQARWSRRIDRRAFVARAVASAALRVPLRPWSPQTKLSAEARTVPGAAIRELRHVRGLE
jgi:glycosyltransferase involved in cell wall biosynthesis